MTNTNYTHAMAYLEVAEIERARHQTHQFTYLYGRQTVKTNDKMDENEPIAVSPLQIQRLDGRLERAKERAFRKNFKPENSVETEVNDKIILPSTSNSN
jgi:hypothetical protein